MHVEAVQASRYGVPNSRGAALPLLSACASKPTLLVPSQHVPVLRLLFSTSRPCLAGRLYIFCVLSSCWHTGPDAFGAVVSSALASMRATETAPLSAFLLPHSSPITQAWLATHTRSERREESWRDKHEKFREACSMASASTADSLLPLLQTSYLETLQYLTSREKDSLQVHLRLALEQKALHSGERAPVEVQT